MSEDMQPKISRQEWESYNQGRMVRLNVNQKGAGRIEILNSFFVENQDVEGNQGIFGDVGAGGLTPENAQNMYNKLVEIHQRNENKPKDVNELKYGSHIYYTKEELTELAEAGGYKVNFTEKQKETPSVGTPAQPSAPAKPEKSREPVKLGFEDASENLSLSDFLKLDKEIRESEAYKNLPFSAPERQAYYKWQNEQYERLRGGAVTTPKAEEVKDTPVTPVKDEPATVVEETSVEEVVKEQDDVIAEDTSILLREDFSPYVVDAKSKEEPAIKEEDISVTANVIAEDAVEDAVENAAPVVTEDVVEDAVEEAVPVVAEDITAEDIPDVAVTTDSEPAPAVKTPTDKLYDFYQGLDENFKAAAEDVIKPVIQAGDIGGYLKIVSGFSPEQFAHAFGNTTVENMADNLGVTPEELTGMIKDINEDSFKMFVAYGESKKEPVIQNDETTKFNAVTDAYNPSDAALEAEADVATQDQSPEDIAKYLNNRADLQSLGEYEKRNILQGELDSLNEKVKGGDNSYETLAKTEQLKKCIAYSTIWVSKMNERDGATYIERVDEKTGLKVVDRIKEGTAYTIDGTFGVKFIQDPVDLKKYKLAPDWDNRLN